MEWKDVTSYSRGEERIPRWWMCTLADGLTLKVGNYHVHYRDDPCWFASCSAIRRGDNWVLGKLADFTEGTAKAEALSQVARTLRTWVEALDTQEPETGDAE